jgi:hypothetical protein
MCRLPRPKWCPVASHLQPGMTRLRLCRGAGKDLIPTPRRSVLILVAARGAHRAELPGPAHPARHERLSAPLADFRRYCRFSHDSRPDFAFFLRRGRARGSFRASLKRGSLRPHERSWRVAGVWLDRERPGRVRERTALSASGRWGGRKDECPLTPPVPLPWCERRRHHSSRSTRCPVLELLDAPLPPVTLRLVEGPLRCEATTREGTPAASFSHLRDSVRRGDWECPSRLRQVTQMHPTLKRALLRIAIRLRLVEANKDYWERGQ